MNTAIVNVRVETVLKKQAQKVASELGISLSAIIHGFLKQLVKTKTVTFRASEEPTEYLLQALKESRENIKAGRVISFEKPENALSYLDKMIENDKKATKN